MITADALTAPRRRDVYGALIWAAGLYGDDILLGADRAAALGRSPHAGPFAEQVRDTVGAAVPGLLARWDTEPSASQLALAALAAIFPAASPAPSPAAGEPIGSRVGRLAMDLAGTQAGAYARCAHQLVSGDSAGGLATAVGIEAWNDDLRSRDLGNELVSPRLRACYVLCEAVPSAIAAVS
jgi:hypothetical protein